MRQLTSVDSQFLALETRRQTRHVAGVAILDASTTPGGSLAVADIEALITERLPLLPPLRWRLLEVPLGLGYPYWVDDEDFDLHFHVRELGLAAPGSDEQLAEQVARIVSRPLDRARPLWELYLISGLQSGHLALLTKIHHAVIDGMAGAEILGLLLDLTPEVRTLETNGPWGDNEAVPGELGMLARGIVGAARYPLRALTALPGRCRTSRRRSSSRSLGLPRWGASSTARSTRSCARRDPCRDRSSRCTARARSSSPTTRYRSSRTAWA